MREIGYHERRISELEGAIDDLRQTVADQDQLLAVILFCLGELIDIPSTNNAVRDNILDHLEALRESLTKPCG
jgi:hypothetical protein